MNKDSPRVTHEQENPNHRDHRGIPIAIGTQRYYREKSLCEPLCLLRVLCAHGSTAIVHL